MPGTTTAKLRLTADGRRAQYDSIVRSDTADLTTVKLHWHALVSPGRRRATADIKAFYLGSPLETPVYIAVPLEHFPEHIVEKRQGG